MNTKLVLLAAPLVLLALLALGCNGDRKSFTEEEDGDDTFVSAVPPGAERIQLAMGDFCFYPQELHLPAGKTVQIEVKNLGNVRHELMAGRELGGHGYEQDFFGGLKDIQATGDPRGYQWNAESEEGGHGGEGEEAEGGHGHGGGGDMMAWSPEGEQWDCDGQVKANAGDVDYDMYAHHEQMMGEAAGSAEQHMDGDSSAPGGDMEQHMDGAAPSEHMEADQASDEHAGATYELNLDAGASAYITFTVPEDFKGEWEIGCFIPRHYERGMGAKFIVE